MQHYAAIYLLQNHLIYFEYPSHPSSGVHQTVIAAYGTATTSIRGCSYSFTYSWWWVWWRPETCRV